MFTAICVQYRATAAQVGSKNTDIEKHDIEDSSISKLKTTISVYIDIERAFFDIDISSISGHGDIEVINFGIDVINFDVFDILLVRYHDRSFS